MPDLIKFIYLAQLSNNNDIFSLNSHFKNNAFRHEHYPRIVFENFIIWPETWKLDFTQEQISIDEFKEKLYERVGENSIILFEDDGLIYINLYDKRQVEYLYSKSKKGKVILFENIYNKMFPVLSDDLGNKYVSEFVFSINTSYGQNKKPAINMPFFAEPQSLSKWIFLPLDTWICTELHLKEELINYVLLEKVETLVKNMITNNEISNFFFIRYYTQNSATLRLRFKYVSTKKEIVLEKINSLHEKLYLENIIKKSTYDSYEREVGRYGGLDSLELAENIFFIDSMNAFVLIDAIINLEKEKMMECIILYFVCLFLNSNINTDEAIVSVKTDKDYRIIKKHLFKTVIHLVKYKDEFHQINLNEVDSCYQWICSCNIYSLKMLKLDKLSKEQMERVFLDVVHMSFNRLWGIDEKLEKKVISYSKKIISDAKSYLRNK